MVRPPYYYPAPPGLGIWVGALSPYSFAPLNRMGFETTSLLRSSTSPFI